MVMMMKKIICLTAIALLAIAISSVYADSSGSKGSGISPIPTPTPEPQPAPSHASADIQNFGSQSNNIQNDKNLQTRSEIVNPTQGIQPKPIETVNPNPNDNTTPDPNSGNKNPSPDNKFPLNNDYRYLYGSSSSSSSDDDSSGTGTLYVSSSPGGASVYVDSGYSGITPAQGALTITDLSAGTHEVLVTASGYNDFSTTVTIESGQISTVHAVL